MNERLTEVKAQLRMKRRNDYINDFEIDDYIRYEIEFIRCDIFSSDLIKKKMRRNYKSKNLFMMTND